MMILLLVDVSLYATPAKTRYPFKTPEQKQLFNELLPKLRCLVCQNESLADSDAELAKDLRQVVYKKVLAGENQQTIIHDLTQRYGEFILFKPPLNRKTYILWFAPFVFLVLGLLVLFYIIWQRRKNNNAYEEEGRC